MWFCFGFLTLFAFIAYRIPHSLRSRWKGIPGEIGSREYEWAILKNKSKTYAYMVGVPAPAQYNFTLKPETWVDRTFKWIGLSAEFQTRDERFDKAIYVASDDWRVGTKLGIDPQLREHLLRIFSAVAGEGDMRVKEICCKAGCLWVRIKPTRKSADLSPRLLQTIVPALAAASHALEQHPAQPVADNDRFLLKATAILIISSSLGINGALHLLRMTWGYVPFTLDTGTLYIASLAVGGAIIVALVVATIFLIGGTARAHLVLMDVLLVGTFGAMITAFAELRDLNMEWDTGPVTAHYATVAGKDVKRGRRSSKRYYLLIDKWSPTYLRYKMRVSSSLYDQTTIGRQIRVHVRPGLLGARWVQQVDTL
jgi:hypothetical protein